MADTTEEASEETTEDVQEPKTGVMLLAHGAPLNVKDIPKYLMNIRGGKVSSQEVIDEVRSRYEQIGGSSPLLSIATAQANALEEYLAQGGNGFKVYLGMRVWEPYIKDVVKQAYEDGIRRLVVLCLAPQYSDWSTERYWKAFLESLKDVPEEIEVEFVSSWASHPCLIDAFEERYRAAADKMKAEGVESFHTIFTVHSIPEGFKGKNDPYVLEYNRTLEGLVQRLNPEPYHQAYQSQGMIPVPWLGPSVEETIDKIAEEGGKHILLVPVGFVCDHIEILYDVDIAFKDYAAEKGITLYRTESLNTSPLLIETLAGVVWEQLLSSEAPEMPRDAIG